MICLLWTLCLNHLLRSFFLGYIYFVWNCDGKGRFSKRPIPVICTNKYFPKIWQIKNINKQGYKLACSKGRCSIPHLTTYNLSADGFYRTQVTGVRSLGPSVCPSQTFVESWEGNPRHCVQCKWRDLVTNFVTNASFAIWWPNLELKQGHHLLAKFVTDTIFSVWLPNLELMQVAPPGSQICY